MDDLERIDLELTGSRALIRAGTDDGVTFARSTRLAVGLWGVAGAATLGIAVTCLRVSGGVSATAIALAVVFGTLMALSWVRPIMHSTDGQSDGIDLDEAFLVLLVLLVPPALAVVVFAAASLVAQVVKRQVVLKSLLEVGRVVTSAGVAAAVFWLLHGTTHADGYASIGAALVSALCYFLVNTAAMVSIMATLGSPWRRTVLGGLQGKVLVTAGGVALGIPAALLLASAPQYVPLVVIPLLLLRYFAAGHFDARHDRERLQGLFEATLEVNRSMGVEHTRSAVLGAARTLLRSPDVVLSAEQPEGEGLVAPVVLADRTLWLGVSGRSRTEPFDEADHSLLEALASVGAIAMANAELYSEVQQQREHLSAITSSLGEGVCALSESGEITFMNPAGAAMLGWYGVGTVDGQVFPTWPTPAFLLEPALRAIALRRNVTSYDTRFERLDGSHFPVTMTASPVVGEASPSGAVIVFRDMSERKAFEEQLARHAFQDALTGLANRRLLLDHLDHALLQADRTGDQVAVLFCDIDRFKLVNDKLGHQVGDELLRVIGDRLRRAVRPGDTLSRFGGDEFVIVLEGVSSPEDASRVAGGVLDALRDPISLSAGHEVAATMSIGVALSEHGKSRDDLLHDADVAMYRAKERGRGGQYALFDVDPMGMRSIGRLDLDTALHHAIDRGEIEVHYQPLVSVCERRIVGAEALVRWNHPEEGLLYPAQFIKLAEDNGTILPIGRFVLEQACRQAKTWQQEFGVTLQVGVNLSARQFQQVGLADEVATVLRATAVDPGQLSIEITESLAMDDVDLTTSILQRLRSLGVCTAIDDFGTGHSSLGYLARFPVDAVKIDQSFVRGIEHDPVKSAIVSAVVALSQAIGSTTVVEGVETEAELSEVELLGCDVAQGHYFARPVSAGTFSKMLTPSVDAPPELRLLRGSLAV